MSKVLELKNINKIYKQAGEDLQVLHDVNMSVKSGEIVALVGPSGSGKTTLLQIAGLLDSATSGEILIAGENASAADEKSRTKLRRENLGFVYQFHHLLEEFSAIENVAIPQIVKGISKKEAIENAAEMLKKMGLGERLSHRPAQLSGGQQQRTAIARALVNKPKLLLADEPTGNLDHATSANVFDVMVEVIKANNCGAIIATHNLEIAKKMDRILNVQDGVVS